MTRLKNKFYLILAGIVGLCLSFCTFLMPKKVDVASADTTSMVESSTHYYAHLPKNLDMSLIVLPQLPNGTLMAIEVFSNSTILGGSLARIRYISLSDTPGYISFYTNGKIGRDYYIPLSRGDLPITRLEICLFEANTNPSNNTVSRYGYTNPIDIVTFDYGTDAFNNGYSSGYQEGYDVGNVDGFDNGYFQGDIQGYARGLLEERKGLWGTEFVFTFGNEEVFVYVGSENYDVYDNGGIFFDKIYPLFVESCNLQGVTVPDTSTTNISCKIRINPTNYNLSLLRVGSGTLSDGYYLSNNARYWGSFQGVLLEGEETTDIFEFIPYTTLTVIPDYFVFDMGYTWDFTLYLNDDTVGLTDYNIGYNAGYGSGFNAGYTEGYDEGDKVTSETLQNAYNDGYSVGISKAENFDFAYAVSTVIGAPVTVVKDFLNFELLGVNLLAFISGIITLLIIVKCIKFFL